MTEPSKIPTIRDLMAQNPATLDRNETLDIPDAIMNLGRIRELMSNPVEERYVLVNIPAFQLEAVQKYEVQQRHRVIVGRTERQSPSVKATIRALNFFPYWRVPDSVAHLDLIPRLMKEPDYLQNEKIRVLDAAGVNEVDPQTVNWTAPEAQKLKFRQDPGPQNALGLGVIDVKSHEVESPAVVAERIRQAAKIVPPDRLTVNPDCGLVHLPRDVTFAKLCAMVEGTRIVRRELGA